MGFPKRFSIAFRLSQSHGFALRVAVKTNSKRCEGLASAACSIELLGG
jgi:hypothetical protein